MPKLFQILASRMDAYARCIASGNDWSEKHLETIKALVAEHMPHGSGFDNGTELDTKTSAREKLIFATSFHHMDDNGSYDGWTEHTVTVRPSLVHGFGLTVSGRNVRGIKDHIAEAFESALSTEISRDDEVALAVRLGHRAA